MDPTVPLYIGTPEDDQDTSSRDSQVLEGLSRAIQEMSSFYSETDPSQQDGATLTSSASGHSNWPPEFPVEQLQIFVDVNESLIHSWPLTDSTSQQLDLLSCTTLLQGTGSNSAYPGSQTRHMNRSGPSAPPYYHSATSHINPYAPPYDFAAASLMDPYHRYHVNTAPCMTCAGFPSSYIPYSPSPQLSGLMTSTSGYQFSPPAPSPAWRMGLQEFNTCENLPLPDLQNCIVSYPGSANGGLQDYAVSYERDSICNEDDTAGMESEWIISRLDNERGSENKEKDVTRTKVKRYSKANSKKIEIDAGIGTKTSELTNKKQRLEEFSCQGGEAGALEGSNRLDVVIDSGVLFKPGLTTSMGSGNPLTSTIQVPMGMDHWVLYEECMSANGWTDNKVISMEDWHSVGHKKDMTMEERHGMDYSKVMDTSSGGIKLDSHLQNQLLADATSTESSIFLHGLMRDTWMGFDGSLLIMNEMGAENSFPVEYSDNNDSQPDTADPKCLTLKCNRRSRNTKKVKDEHVLAPLNRTDPCSYFPTEVWLIVLKHLPLSVIANTSTVSILWLEGARSYQGWKVAARSGKMGVPGHIYKTFMSLVCSRSFFTCDRCFGSSMNMDMGSQIPLPVAIEGKARDIWLLCHSCRYEYYQTHPEQNRPPCNRQDRSTYKRKAKVTRVEAQERYGLPSKQLKGIKRRIRNSLAYYKEDTIQKKACMVHSGWVGVDAVLGNLQMDRHLQYQTRLTADKTRSPPTKRNAGKIKDVHVKGKEKVEARDTSADLVPAQYADCGNDLWNLSTDSWHDPFDVTPLWIGTFSGLGRKDENELGQGIGNGSGLCEEIPPIDEFKRTR